MTKSKRITIHVDQKTFDKFNSLAIKNNRSLSDFMFLFINKKYDKLKLHPIEELTNKKIDIQSDINQQLLANNKRFAKFISKVIFAYEGHNNPNPNWIELSKFVTLREEEKQFINAFKQQYSKTK